MQESDTIPDALTKLQRSLKPYVKQRQEATHIRRVLAAHLNANLDTDGHPAPRPLSLLDASCSVESTLHGVRGLQKDYMRHARANINARREFNEIKKVHQSERKDLVGTHREREEGVHAIEHFLGLVSHQQKHEVLCIIQDYIDMLGQKPTAMAEYLDPKEVLKDVESLPQVPPEVLNVSGGQQRSGVVDLEELVDRLEKSVLRAKLLLKREQKLLAKVKSDQEKPHVSEAGKLQALGTTRNELINWIESELARAGESSTEAVDGNTISSPEKKSTESIDAQLASIQQQYSRYTKARQSLIIATSGVPDTEGVTAPVESSDSVAEPSESGTAQGTSYITYPYLEELVALSNEQKAIIQQKSHLTINLAKQLKESSQNLERLKHESHLLPAHPMPTNPSLRKGLDASSSFGDEISKHEKPDSARGARAWVHASESASNSTKEAILEKLEEGSMAIDESRQIMLELQRLLGNETTVEGNAQESSSDIWSVLDGSLGVINQESLSCLTAV